MAEWLKAYNWIGWQLLKGLIQRAKGKGQILCRVGKDENNHMYTIAWTVCLSEDKYNWRWILLCLSIILDLGNGSTITLASDMQNVSKNCIC